MEQKIKSGFTLAEVLITLGIIGIVAAMTIPGLIAKHQKIVTATQLKKAYTTIAQAFTMAQKDYGDISGWDFKPSNPEDGDTTSLKTAITLFAKTYLIPYLSVITDCGAGKEASKQCFYTWYTTDGTALNYTPSDNLYRFILNNTTLIQLSYDNSAGDYTIGHVLIYVDINGFNKPNTISKDIFVMSLTSSGRSLKMYGAGRTRETLLNAPTNKWGCKNKGAASNTSIYCGALIQQDGWVIKDDYPWF